jgi:hypothetical protein
MTYQLALPDHRRYTTQKIMVQCHELLTSLQCHELFSRRTSCDGGRAISGRLLYSLSCRYCNDNSLYSPGERLPAISPDVPRPANHPPPPPQSTYAVSLPRKRGGGRWRFHRSREVGDVGNS